MSQPMDCWLYAALYVLSTASVYLPALDYPLLYDDVAAVQRNPDVYAPFSLRSLLTNDFWGTPLASNFSHQSYRPLTVLTFRLFDGDVYRQRIFNVALHVLNSVLLGLLAQRFLGRRYGKLCAALFCIHPIHVEAVVQLVGRAELLCASFYLSCLLSPSYPVACVFTALATASKEQGVTALAVKVSLDVLEHLAKRRHNRYLWKEVLLSTVVTVSLLAARLTISGRAPTFHKLDNPARLLESPFRQINLAYLPLFNFHLLLNPHKQSCDYTFNSVPLIRSCSDGRVLQLGVFVLVVVAAAVALLRKPLRATAEDEKLNNNNYLPLKLDETPCAISTSSSVALSALVMTVLPWLPGSNILFYVGFVVAERVLYLPSMGVCFLVAFGFSKLLASLPERRTVLRSVLVVVCGCLLMKSAIRSRQWQTGVQVFGSALRVFPGKNARPVHLTNH